MERTVIQTQTKRIFRICKLCKNRETIDYTVDTIEQVWKGEKVRHWNQYRMDGDQKIEYGDDRNRWRCPSCGAYAGDGYHQNFTERTLKRVELVATHVCDDRCRMATSDTCKCSCGGENHGIAHKREL